MAATRKLGVFAQAALERSPPMGTPFAYPTPAGRRDNVSTSLNSFTLTTRAFFRGVPRCPYQISLQVGKIEATHSYARETMD